MARREMNKGWKIFGWFIIGIIIAAVVFCAVVWIASAVNHIGFVDQLKNWFKPEKTAEEAETVVAAVRALFRK